jgi:RHS repeat-associated protein
MKRAALSIAAIVSIALPASAQTRIQLTWDADGGRISKQVNNTPTHYPFGDDYEVTAGVVTKYIGFAGETVAKRVGPTTTWVHVDSISSVQAVSSSSGGSLQRLAYGPFGDRLHTATDEVEPISYTGQRQDESGLFYLHARYYDPALSRFIGPDEVVPSFSNVGLNRYAYAINDPVNHTDVTGYGPDTPWGAFWGSIGSGLKDIGVTAGRIVIEPATLLYDVGGYSAGIVNPYYNHQPVSFSGQAYHGVQFGSREQLAVAAQAQANIWTLGGYGTVQGAREYAATGDPTAWRQAATGQLMATAGARSAVRASQARAQASMQRRIAAMETWAAAQDAEMAANIGPQLVVGGGRSMNYRGQGPMPELHPGDVSLNIDPGAEPDIVGSIGSAPQIPTGSFHSVFFERLPYTEFTGENAGALAEAARVLRPGGRLFIRTGIYAESFRSEILGNLGRAGFRDVSFAQRNQGIWIEATRGP